MFSTFHFREEITKFTLEAAESKDQVQLLLSTKVNCKASIDSKSIINDAFLFWKFSF